MQYKVETDGHRTVIRLNGEITAPDRTEFDAACEQALAGTPQTVVVDMSGLTYMDSAGLGFLLILLKQAEAMDGAVVLAAPQGWVKEQLELARFHLLFDIKESL